MSDHHHIVPHCLEISRRIDERFALRHTRARGGNVDGIGRQSLFGELERDARARRILEEEIDDRRAAQCRHFFDRSFTDFLERLGRIEDEPNLIARERLEPEKVLAERSRHAADLGTTTTSVLSSSSATITSTRSSGPTSIFLPTTSA